MSTQPKPRADSRLKTLPPDRQASIAEHAASHKLEETVVWLREDGIKSNRSSLSEFLSWYSLQQQFREDGETTEALLEQLKAEVPGLTDEKLDELGQRTFSLLSIRRKDLAGFVTVRSAATKAQLERAKLKLREQAESRLERQAQLAREKFKESVRTKIQSGLAELSQHIKSNPKAQAAYEALEKVIAEATK